MKYVGTYPRSLAAFDDVVFENVNAINGRNRNDQIALEIQLAAAVFSLHDLQFAAQNLGQEVACPAGGLKEARVDPLGFLLHQIEHGIHLPLAGEHFAVIGNPFPGYNLTGH